MNYKLCLCFWFPPAFLQIFLSLSGFYFFLVFMDNQLVIQICMQLAGPHHVYNSPLHACLAWVGQVGLMLAAPFSLHMIRSAACMHACMGCLVSELNIYA
ncbi:hypothetical protein I3760_11G021900 [Carya illinoinensis]|nr:hypothetical protein I3760_11G021900 [Carya illinoinensis]